MDEDLADVNVEGNQPSSVDSWRSEGICVNHSSALRPYVRGEARAPDAKKDGGEVGRACIYIYIFLVGMGVMMTVRAAAWPVALGRAPEDDRCGRYGRAVPPTSAVPMAPTALAVVTNAPIAAVKISSRAAKPSRGWSRRCARRFDGCPKQPVVYAGGQSEVEGGCH